MYGCLRSDCKNCCEDKIEVFDDDFNGDGDNWDDGQE